MKALNAKELRQIGADYVFEKLNPITPFGKEAARNIRPFFRADRDGLLAELLNVEKARESNADYSHIFVKFRDFRGSLKKLYAEDRVLSDVELFEMKSFLLTLDELSNAYNSFLYDIKIYPIDSALKILDPDGTRLRSFYVSEKYSEKLSLIRKKKQNMSEFDEEWRRVTAEEEDEEFAVRVILTKKLSAHKEDITKNIEAIGKLDLTLAKAALAKEYNAVMPAITQAEIRLTDMFSPSVKAALEERGRRVTPVSLALSPGVMVLTGANMGGKSVALKTLALNAYLFQCGFLVFAKEAELPLFDSIDFIFEDEASVRSGLSSFGAEIARVNEIISGAENSFSLIIFDEPAKGTNPKEGRAVAAGLAAFLNKLKSISVLSTHYDNVAKPEYNLYTAAGLKPPANDKNLSPKDISELMDYRLLKTDARAVPNDALNICKLLGVSDDLMSLILNEVGL